MCPMVNTIPDREFEGLKDLMETYPKVNFETVLITKDLEGMSDDILHVPISYWSYLDRIDLCQCLSEILGGSRRTLFHSGIK